MPFEGKWLPSKTDGKRKLAKAGAHRSGFELAICAVHALVFRLYTHSWLPPCPSPCVLARYHKECAKHHATVVHDLARHLTYVAPRNWHDLVVFELGFLYLSYNVLNCTRDPTRAHQLGDVRAPTQHVQQWLDNFHQINPAWPTYHTPFLPHSDPAWQDWQFARDLFAFVQRQQSRLER